MSVLSSYKYESKELSTGDHYSNTVYFRHGVGDLSSEWEGYWDNRYHTGSCEDHDHHFSKESSIRKPNCRKSNSDHGSKTDEDQAFLKALIFIKHCSDEEGIENSTYHEYQSHDTVLLSWIIVGLGERTQHTCNCRVGTVKEVEAEE